MTSKYDYPALLGGYSDIIQNMAARDMLPILLQSADGCEQQNALKPHTSQSPENHITIFITYRIAQISLP